MVELQGNTNMLLMVFKADSETTSKPGVQIDFIQPSFLPFDLKTNSILTEHGIKFFSIKIIDLLKQTDRILITTHSNLDL